MRSLPPLDLRTKTNHAPHVLILGAGASLAAFPNGDRAGRSLPLMNNLVEVTGLAPVLQSHGISLPVSDFEGFYDRLVAEGKRPELVEVVEQHIHRYFSSLILPDEATLYDHLLLSLREKDLIATFNWDPFLAYAYKRNVSIRKLPQLAFLHGNVAIGVCYEHRTKGFIGDVCSECRKTLTASRRLYPVRQKNYNNDAFISNEWNILREFLQAAYLVTIFGYSAPKTDIEARSLMLDQWRANPTRELAQISIIDVDRRSKIEAAWQDFFVSHHYGIHASAFTTSQFRHPRRSCEAFAMASLQQQPWQENPMRRFNSLPELQQWIMPLLEEEERGTLTGDPCQ